MPTEARSGQATEFAADAASLRLTVGRLSRLLRRQESDGVTPSQISVLATLHTSGAMRMGDLAAREGVAAPTVTRQIAILEASGLVARNPDPTDGRSSVIALTRAGNRYVSTVRAKRTAYLSARIAALSHADRRRLAAALPVLQQLATDDEVSR
ncbi:MAG: MarR family winged helix-turn-helix transcriptional regulator [Geodermatophilaceae bacterium]